MNPIYDFERGNPPVLNERMIHMELDRRKAQWRMILLVLAGVLSLVVALVLGIVELQTEPVIALALIGYVVVSTTGGGVLALFYAKEGGFA